MKSSYKWNFFEAIATIGLAIIFTPIAIIEAVLEFWKGILYGFNSLGEFLNFGRVGYFDSTALIVGTNINNILFDSKIPYSNTKSWDILCKMRVYSYNIHEGRLFIKVYYNDKLIELYKKAKEAEAKHD